MESAAERRVGHKERESAQNSRRASGPAPCGPQGTATPASAVLQARPDPYTDL